MNTSMKHKTPQEHIASIFKEFTTPSRVLRSFTNLSNTVIQTALSGHNKFLFEILQNADDAFEDEHKPIAIKFILQQNYLIVQHNGKGFDYNDVERICDYASQIEEVKANDLSKTGYKGLGFKSLFNVSNCIYIYSNNYSFRFDKAYWPDSSSKPWQVIPIWCRKGLPLSEKVLYDQPVNFILRVKDSNEIKNHLHDLLQHSDLLLYLNRINGFSVHFEDEKYCLERKVEKFGSFSKVDIYENQNLLYTWLLITYTQTVMTQTRKSVQEGSRFIYPDKIKKAKEIPFTFAIRTNESLDEILRIRGVCYSTLPTELHLMLPYHINCFFILNLDRTQLHENEWNAFLLQRIGYLQFNLLRDLAEVAHLKNYVLEIFVRKIDHPYTIFSEAFLRGFNEAKSKIAWIPAYQGSHLLKLGEAWTDRTEFFKQNFQNIQKSNIFQHLIDYDVKQQCSLFNHEANRFTYRDLFIDFPDKYYPQLTKSSYVSFINYLYEKSNDINGAHTARLKETPFLVGKNSQLLAPKNALLEVSKNPIPDFLRLNPIDDEYLPSNNTNYIKDWLVFLGARRLSTPVEILRESFWKWFESGNFENKINKRNHIEIITYLAQNIEQFTRKEIELLKEKLLLLTKSNIFNLAKSCYLPDVVSVMELADVISEDEIISLCYDTENLRNFIIHVGVKDEINPIEVLRKTIFPWIKNNEIGHKLTKKNYVSITKYISQHYSSMIRNLTEYEMTLLKTMPVLTRDYSFQKAEDCYFPYAIPKVKGFETVIPENKVVSMKNLGKEEYDFLKYIGVSDKISPIEILRRSVLKWIKEGLKSRINLDNHQGILNYISENWHELISSTSFCKNDLNSLKSIPILTKTRIFKAAKDCYWPISDSNEIIPGIEDVISPNEFVSLDYCTAGIRMILEKLGVRNLRFFDVYDKYSDHLNCRENVEWFFSHLISHWERKESTRHEDPLLKKLQIKFKSAPCLVTKNGQMCYSSEIYSSQFRDIYDIDNNAIYLLDFEKLPESLENWLDFKQELELDCIDRILKTIEQSAPLGEEKTRNFYTILLRQLTLKDVNEIKKYQLSLFSQENKLIPAKDLYYFEEDKTCFLDSCYLKRIVGMSHDEVKDLAKLSGVNVLPFDQQLEFGELIPDDTLKEFYLERLPFIVFEESKKLNESHSITLKKLFNEISLIQLYKCSKILIHYPFGSPYSSEYYSIGLKVYTTRNWKSLRSKIHTDLEKVLNFKADLMDLRDMELTSEEIEHWLRYKNTTFEELHAIEKELRDIRSKELIELVPEKKVPYLDEGDKPEEMDQKKSTHDLSSESSENELSNSSVVNVSEDKVNATECHLRCMEDVTDDSFSDVCEESMDEVESHLQPQDEDEQNNLDERNILDELNLNEQNNLDEQNNRNANEYTPREVQRSNVDNNWLAPESSGARSLDQRNAKPNSEINWKDKRNMITQDTCGNKYTNSEFSFSDASFEIRTTTTIHESEIRVNENDAKLNCDVIKFNARMPMKCENEISSNSENVYTRDKGTIQPEISVCSFPTDISTFQTFSEFDERSSIKRQSENYVFNVLKSHLRKKHANSICNMSNGTFTLQSQLPFSVTELIWLNQNEEKGLPYDLLLKQDGQIKRLIEVEPSNSTVEDSFNLSHHDFMKRINLLSRVLPYHKEMYYICRVFNNGNIPYALYKVVPLMMPQI